MTNDDMRLIWEGVQKIMDRCPVCSGALSAEDIDARTEGYGCDTGCMIALLEITHDCGYEGEASTFGEWHSGEPERDDVYGYGLETAIELAEEIKTGAMR